jgi:CheY-like chemotaxis protein
VVDDAPTTIKVMERALTQMGSDVHTATNGFMALKMMKSRLYTLVIMDIQMPVMDGFEAVRQLRAWERGPEGDGRHQYIIGASASPDEGTRKDALDVSMDEYGVKPLNIPSIVQKSQELLRIRTQREECVR